MAGAPEVAVDARLAQRRPTVKEQELGSSEITIDPATPHRKEAAEQIGVDLESGSHEKANVEIEYEGFWHRWNGGGRRKIPWRESAVNIAFSSWLNLFLVFVPLSWVAHFMENWNDSAKFALAFLAIIPLVRLLEYGGHQVATYCGKDLGDFVVISLDNAVEATLAINLLTKCDVKLLQSTVIGVVLLHLLFIPGTAFVVGGVRILEQDLNPHKTQLNHSLLTCGVMALLVPAAFFAAIEQNGAMAVTVRPQFLQMSRGIGIILLLLYVGSRIFLLNPPGDDEIVRESLPTALKHEELRLKYAEPEVSSWACLLLLVITVGVMATTVEWLVESLESVRKIGAIPEEWFGLVLLPLVSFSADGTLAVVFFIRTCLRFLFGTPPPPPALIAQARAIDLSIQFLLFWMPILVLLGWGIHKPMSLLFDLFEVALLIGACFLVNYVTADSKTNWAEGMVLISFYLTIVLCAWFYPGQAKIHELATCNAPAAG